MHLRKLKLINFKGVTAVVPLEQRTIFVGKKGIGKSARLFAVPFVITGKTPLGDRTTDVAALMSDDVGCMVEAELSDGTQFTRQCTRGNGSTKTKATFNGINLTLADTNNAIAEKVGAFAPMFNMQKFVDMSPEKHREAFMGLCSAAQKWDAVELLKSLGTAPLEIDTAIYDAACTSTANRIAPGDLDSVAAEILNTNALSNSHKRTAIEASAAVKRLADQKAELRTTACKFPDAATATERIAVLTTEHSSVVGQLGMMQGKQASIDMLKKQRKRLAQTRKDAEKKLVDGLEPYANLIAEENRLKTVEPAQPEDVNPNNEELNAGPESSRAETALSNAKIAHATATARLKAGQANPYVKILSLIKDATGKIDISAISHFDPLIAFVTELVSDVDLPALDKAVLESVEVLTKCQTAATHAMAELERLNKNVQDRFAEHGVAKDARNSWLMSVKTNTLDVSATEKARAGFESTIKDCDTQVLENEKAMRKLDEDGGTPADELKEQCVSLATAITEAGESRDALIRESALETEYLNASKTMRDSKIMQAVFTMVCKKLKEFRDSHFRELVEPLLASIGEVLRGADIANAPYCDLQNERGTAKFDLGWVCNDRKVSLRALSGGEAAVFTASLAIALVKLADPPLKLLLLECGEIDEESLAMLMRAIVQAAPDFQAILATHLPIKDTTNWAVERL